MLSNFAKRFDILIHLVAHPRKMQAKDGVFEVPNYYDINGSANFANKADFCITVHRNKSKDQTEIHVNKVKFKNLGCQGVGYLKYDIDSGNYRDAEKESLPFDCIVPPQQPEQNEWENINEILQDYRNKKRIGCYSQLL
jgi:twinkle protein